jgi:hypothetical protein
MASYSHGIKNLIFLVIGFFMAYRSDGQQSLLGKSIVLDTTDPKYVSARNNFVKKYKVYKNAHIVKLKNSFKDKAGKELIKTYEASSEEIMQQVTDNQFIFCDEIDSLVKTTLSKFHIAELSDQKDLIFLINKDLSLNAYCLSDGLILINAGLFIWLQNNDQFASVMAHELAHHTLDHYNKYQHKSLVYQNSKEGKNEIKEIKNQKVNKAQMAKSVLQQKIYNQARQSRMHELEADSAGYNYYIQAGFEKKEYIKAMELMLKYETLPILDLDTSVYYTLFDLPQQKFKQSWLKGEDFDQYHYLAEKKEFHEDSLHTHPSIDDRIKHLKKNYPIVTDTTAMEPDKNFTLVSNLVLAEVLPVFYFNEDYGSALYGVIRYLANDVDNAYLRNWLGFLFSKVYDARKGYLLNRYVETVDMRDKNKSYQQFLSFIWQLNLNEIKIIADHYNKKP